MRRRIKKARARFISFVPRGANGLSCLYKEADASVEFRTLSKLDEDRGELLAVVYAPEIRDSQGDIASAEVIKDMAYASAREGVDLDIRHDGKVVDKSRAYIAERFIVQKGDERFAGWKNYDGQSVDVTGGWAVVTKIEDPALRAAYKAGAWNGVSLQGPAEVEIEKSDIDVDAVAKALAERLKKEPGMTLEELNKALDARESKLIETIVAKIAGKPPEKAPEITKDDETFDPLNLAHVEKKLADLERAEVAKSLGDMTDPATLRAHRDLLKKGSLTSESVEQRVERLTKETNDLKAKLKKAEGASAIPPASGSTGDVVEDGLSKEDRDAVAEGRAMAAFVNKGRGFAAKS